jgi:cold shock CspA family protein
MCTMTAMKFWGASIRTEGIVRLTDDRKGHGLISRESGADVFVKCSAVVGEVICRLATGDRVQFEIVEEAEGPQAFNVRRLLPLT